MMKKLPLLALLLCMALTVTACSHGDIGEYYERAQLYLGCGDYAYAADLFAQLGEYEDAADYALYASALQALKEDKYDLARANFEAVNPFKSSGRYLMYLDALGAEEDGEMEAALALYEKLGTFAGANEQAARLRKEIPEAVIQEGRALMNQGEYEAARELLLSLEGYGASKTLADSCTTALNKAAYQKADDLAKSGDLLAAMEAFTALGDTLGAAKRAQECLAAIHAELDKQYTAVTLATAPALIESYALLGEDEIAQTRMAELTARFGSNLLLLTTENPVVALGRYPQAESGGEQPVMWRVIRKEGSLLTLLSEKVLDASAQAVPVPVTFDEAETVGEVMLPAMVDLAARTELLCTATAYALAQGAPETEGAAAYWLRDSLENGLHPIISASGAMALPEEGMTPGVRPMIILDLENITFTAGSGTAEDPFCIR